MQADSYQESVWVDKWRDDIAFFLIKQQWSIPSVGAYVRHQSLILHGGNDGRTSEIADASYRDHSHATHGTFFTAPRNHELHLDRQFMQSLLLEAHALFPSRGGSCPLPFSFLLSEFLTLHIPYITTGLHEIGTHVVRPFFLPPRVKLLDTLQGPYCAVLYCTALYCTVLSMQNTLFNPINTIPVKPRESHHIISYNTCRSRPFITPSTLSLSVSIIFFLHFPSTFSLLLSSSIPLVPPTFTHYCTFNTPTFHSLPTHSHR